MLKYKNFKKKLIEFEKKYGGLTENIYRNKVSPHSNIYFESAFMKGGDRMSSDINSHGYAQYYAYYLKKRFDGGAPKVIVECGILTGIGLAIWCDVFPDARVIGLDIDLSNYESNLPYLVDKGAFKKNTPEVYLFDQFKDNKKLLKEILDGDEIDFFIDDGFHTGDSIVLTYLSIYPFLSDQFLYFIEDNYLASYYLNSQINQRLKITFIDRFRIFYVRMKKSKYFSDFFKKYGSEQLSEYDVFVHGELTVFYS